MVTQSLRGQNLRIMIGSTVFAAETNCTINLNANQQDVSTKDDAGTFGKQETITKSWSIQVEALNVLDAASLLAAIKNLTLFDVEWYDTAAYGSSAGGYRRSGKAYINDITFTWNNREFAAKSVQLTGYGELKKI